MGQGMGALAPFLPLLGLLALVITARRRRQEKKKRFAPKEQPAPERASEE